MKLHMIRSIAKKITILFFVFFFFNFLVWWKSRNQAVISLLYYFLCTCRSYAGEVLIDFEQIPINVERKEREIAFDL